MSFKFRLALRVQVAAVQSHTDEVILGGVVPEGLTLEGMNMEEAENHIPVVRPVELTVEDVGIGTLLVPLVQGGRVVHLADH